jgi:dTDP-3-amino-3,4,6-trideoxy-alpha-D-glucose transaminase
MAGEPVHANDFRRQWEDVRTDSLAAFEAVGASGWYVLGEEICAFEKALAQQWGIGHAVGVASGLDAIEIALRILGCGPGDCVLTTPLSAFATTLAIVKLGATPIFADTDDCGLIDLDLCRKILENRRDIRFFVPVHLYGQALDAKALRSLRESFGVKIVEDCAQSIGAQTGHVGEIAATSFYPTKNLGAMGDGGAILTNDLGFDAQARTLRDYGQSSKYRHESIGYNSRLDELQAALLRRVALPRLEAWTRRRQQIAARYLERIDHKNVRLLRNASSSWHLFPVFVEPTLRESFMTHLKVKKIGIGIHYPHTIPDQPALRGIEHGCPTARRIADSEVSLPIHPYLTDAEVDRVIEAVQSW